MNRWLCSVTLAVALLGSVAGRAETPVQASINHLEHARDFRVRVQAALALGRSADERALGPLLVALQDKTLAVRSAAVAALKNLGDPRAALALRLQLKDTQSARLRAQMESALEALQARPPASTGKPRLFVRLGTLHNGTRVKSAAIERAVLVASRKKLAALPGVQVLPADEQAAPAVLADVPVVMVTTSIERLSASREGASIVYSARVEYLLHTMPEGAIAARVSGSASVTASQEEANDKARSAQVRHSVVQAAVQSALRRAPLALLAAARL